MAKEKKTCFVISPIGEEGSDTRRRADQILKHVIAPAVSLCDFDPIRADHISEPGLITTQVIQHIIDDPLVIADLTGSNPNVFYELAIRHAIRKPLVQIIEKEQKIPFDVAGMRTIPVDHRDLDSVEEAKQEIQKQTNATMAKKPEDIESPISFSIELQALHHSDNPEERSYAEIVSAVSDLRSDLSSIEKKLSSPESLIPPGYLRRILEGPSKRIASHDFDFMLREMMMRLEQIAESQDKRKTSSKETMLEISRLREMLMIMRHEFNRE